MLAFHFKKWLSCLLLAASSTALVAQHNSNFLQYVNPLMGTDSRPSLSTGNTYPAIALPWGMNFWCPQTGKNGDGWMYSYGDSYIRGFKQTHQPSPWINDYGMYSIMPVTGRLKIKEEDRKSFFSHKAETAKPHYYSAYLADHHTTVELTPTERCASFQIHFPATDSAFVVIDAFDKGSYIKIIPSQKKLLGYSTKNSGGVPQNFKNYFVVYFDEAFTWSSATNNEAVANTAEITADHAGAVLQFNSKKATTIHLKTGSSFISWEQAELNVKRELGEDNFATTLQKATRVWNSELGKLQVIAKNTDNLRTFYSCLYRMMLFPRKFYEYDSNNQLVHYSPYNGNVHPGYMFTDNGFWDTFRAAMPFIALMYPAMDANIMEGLANAYKESGFLPEWASPGHRDCMIGSNSASLIADAWIKGIRGFDANLLYEALLKNTNHTGPVSSVGRLGHEYYNRLGYVPYNVNIRENTARTLEYAYADFCLWQLAKALNKPAAEIALFEKRASNYQNVFDNSTGLMRGRNEDGSFQSPFNPFKWGDAFTEGNAWHYSWSVFQDINGLMKLMGGQQAFANKLDSVFLLPPVFDESYYGFVIHEIREMQIMNMGQYAHGNQPIQHMPYLYNYVGQPWKTQYHVRNIMQKLYAATPDGYCGDEDNGQTSAWYVFSALGFYPVCPGTHQYVLGSPLFDAVTLQLENGKKLMIEAVNNSEKNVYVQQVKLNGKPIANNWLNHADLLKGGHLRFIMGALPQTKRGNSTQFAPYSMSK